MPLTFPKRLEDLPIVGQPFTVASWHPTVLLVCHCDGATPIMLVAFAPTPCPKCGRQYTVQAINHDTSTGQGMIGIEHSAPATIPVLS